MRSQAGCLADRAVDVSDDTAVTGPRCGSDVAPDASFEPGRAAGWFDAAYESRRGERVEGVVHGLKGDMAYPIADPGGDRLDAEVITVPDSKKSSATRAAVTRRPAPRSSSAVVGVRGTVMAPNPPS